MSRRPPPPGRRSPVPPRGARMVPRGPRRRPVPTALPRIILSIGLLLGFGLFVGIMAAYGSVTSGLPPVSDIENFDLPQSSIVLSTDGTELAEFAAEDRRVIPFDEIPQVMLDAQIAAEDQTFWDNPCVDFRSIVRAFLQNFQAGETVSGASTICQQLVRMRLFDAELLANTDREFERKLKEAVLALRLDDAYGGREGKEQIIAMYLNQVYYGNNAYGIWAAANAYFAKDITSDDPAQQLTVSEAAMLAGLVRSPSRLDPTQVAVPQTNAEGREILVVPDDAQSLVTRRIVLDQMLESELITQEQHDEALASPVILAPPRSNRYRAPHFVFAVRREAEELLGGEDIVDTAGLRITTTLDYAGYQRPAERWAQVAYDMDRLTDEQLIERYGEDAMAWIGQLQGRNINNDAIVTLNYRTGAILAYVGSAAYYGQATPAHQPNFDVIGQAYRQSGSAFKPITYASGFDSGVITPSTMFMDVRTDIAEGFDPPDADGRERGPVLVRDALKYSLNIPVSKAQQLIGTENVLATAERLGLQFDPAHDTLAVPSMTLGTLGVHQIDLAGAYGAIANGGSYHQPYLIERIEDASGTVIYDHAGSDIADPEQVLSAQSAYLVTDILADNTNPDANPLWGPRFQLVTDAGRRPATLKTGTTNDFKDLQAFGYLAGNPDDPDDPTGAIVTGVWVGNSDFTAIDDVFAADGPTFIWHDYMAEVAALNELPIYDFAAPEGIVEVEVDAMSGLLPGEFTETRRTEVFRADRAPTQQDTTHVELRIEAATGKIWQEGCGDFETVEPSGSPEAGPPEALERVYLDLSDWDTAHEGWNASNVAWIEEWEGRENELNAQLRGIFPDDIDAQLAPTEECTPGEIPTSTPSPSPSPTPSPTPQPTPTPAATPTPILPTVPPLTPTPLPTLSPSPTPQAP